MKKCIIIPYFRYIIYYIWKLCTSPDVNRKFLSSLLGVLVYYDLTSIINIKKKNIYSRPSPPEKSDIIIYIVIHIAVYDKTKIADTKKSMAHRKIILTTDNGKKVLPQGPKLF